MSDADKEVQEVGLLDRIEFIEYKLSLIKSDNAVASGLPLSPWQADRIRKAVASFSLIPLAPENISSRMYHWLRSHYDVNSYKKIRASEYFELMNVIKCQYSAYKFYLEDNKRKESSHLVSTSEFIEGGKDKKEPSTKKGRCSPITGSVLRKVCDGAEEEKLPENVVVTAKKRNITKLMALCPNKHMGTKGGNVASLKAEFSEYRTATDMAIAWHPSGSNGSSYIGAVLKRHDLSGFNIVGAYACRLHDSTINGKKCRVSMYPPEVQEIVLNALIKEGRVVESVLKDLIAKI